MVDATGRALGEHDGEDVEAPGGIGVQEIADRRPVERLVGRRGNRRLGDEQVAHRRGDGFDTGPVVDERGVVQRRSCRSHQRVQRRCHLTDGSVGRVPRVDPLERRVVLAHLPTPLEPMPRLAAHLDMADGSL